MRALVRTDVRVTASMAGALSLTNRVGPLLDTTVSVVGAESETERDCANDRAVIESDPLAVSVTDLVAIRVRVTASVPAAASEIERA